MNNKIFIGGLSYNTTEESLSAKLDEYGKVIAIRIVTNVETGRSRGFGFATFENSSQAEDAISKLNNEMFEGRRVGVKIAIERK